MFEKEKCDLCGECLEKCLNQSLSLEQAQAEFKKLFSGEYSPVLEKCVTCFACEENCPTGAHPFELILEQMGKWGKKPSSEQAIVQAEARYVSDQEYLPPALSGTVISGCVFPKTHPHLFSGPLFENATILKGRMVFCYVLFLHMGDARVIARRAPQMIANLAKTGAEEIVFFHDDCYALVHDLAPRMGIKVPFQAKHIIEHARDWLQANRQRIKPLGIGIAYQRPCASRYSPGKERVVDEIFDLIGVERVERQYDRKRSLCCGGAYLASGKSAGSLQEKNLRDARESGASELVCLCPICVDMLRPQADQLGIKLTHILELVHHALA